MEHVINIVKGPNLLDLTLSLLQGNQKDRLSVRFATEKGTIEVVVNGLLREDGSGKSWIVKGYVLGPSPVESSRVDIYFRTDKRKGVVKRDQ